jgi:hypothetical protein
VAAPATVRNAIRLPGAIDGPATLPAANPAGMDASSHHSTLPPVHQEIATGTEARQPTRSPAIEPSRLARGADDPTGCPTDPDVVVAIVRILACYPDIASYGT